MMGRKRKGEREISVPGSIINLGIKIITKDNNKNKKQKQNNKNMKRKKSKHLHT